MAATRAETPVVVGYDGSAPAECALEWATVEASTAGAPLEVVVAADFPGMSSSRRSAVRLPALLEDAAHERLCAAVEQVRDRAPAVEVGGVVEVGRAAGVLVRAGEGARMVVVGSGTLDVAHNPVGSTCTITASLASAPVVVVRGTRTPATTFGAEVVVGVTASRASEPALRFAVDAARERQVPLTVVSAWGMPASPLSRYASTRQGSLGEFVRQLREESRVALERAVEVAGRRAPGLEVRPRLVESHPWAALEVGSRRAGLLVVGRRGTGGCPGLPLGSVAAAALAHAHCPVAVAGPGADA